MARRDDRAALGHKFRRQGLGLRAATMWRMSSQTQGADLRRGSPPSCGAGGVDGAEPMIAG